MAKSTPPFDLRMLHGANVRRLMARLNMTQQDVVQATGLDERTVRSILHGVTRPHACTLHKLAQGLGIETDELFQDSYYARQMSFDRATNALVEETINSHPTLFEKWTQGDFEELFSRVAVGGEMTETGALAAAEAMNARRELMVQAAVILESNEADLLRDFVTMLYRRVTSIT